MEEIEPAVKKAQEQGLNVVGPVPADSVFYKAYKASTMLFYLCTMIKDT